MAISGKRTPALFAVLLLGVSGLAFGNAALPTPSLFRQALEAYLDEQYAQAADLFEKALVVDPENRSASIGMKSARKKQKALLDQRMERERPNIAASRDYMKRGAWVEAADRLRGVLSRVPDHPQALKMSQDLRDRTENLYRKARPETGEWFYLKGVQAYLDGEWESAAAIWGNVYAFNPDMIFLVDNIDRAKRTLAEQRVLDQKRSFQTAALDHMQHGRFEQSIKAWSGLLKMEPASVLAQEGIRQSQEGLVKEIARKKLVDSQLLAQQGVDAFIEGKKDRAMALWRRSLDIDPRNALARDHLRRLRAQEKGEDEEIQLPGEPEADEYKRGLDFAEKEQYADAVESLERHLGRNPKDDQARGLLAQVQERQKKLSDMQYQEGLEAYSEGYFEAAIQKWQGILKINPDYHKARLAIIKAMAAPKTPA